MHLTRPEIAAHFNDITSADWSVKDVAKALSVSDNHIRNMITRGEISCFRVGGRVIRIPSSEIERIRKCQNSGQGASAATTTPSGGTAVYDDAAHWAQQTLKRQRFSSSHSRPRTRQH